MAEDSAQKDANAAAVWRRVPASCICPAAAGATPIRMFLTHWTGRIAEIRARRGLLEVCGLRLTPLTLLSGNYLEFLLVNDQYLGHLC